MEVDSVNSYETLFDQIAEDIIDIKLSFRN